MLFFPFSVILSLVAVLVAGAVCGMLGMLLLLAACASGSPYSQISSKSSC
jgi:hypothetical protein